MQKLNHWWCEWSIFLFVLSAQWHGRLVNPYISYEYLYGLWHVANQWDTRSHQISFWMFEYQYWHNMQLHQNYKHSINGLGDCAISMYVVFSLAKTCLYYTWHPYHWQHTLDAIFISGAQRDAMCCWCVGRRRCESKSYAQKTVALCIIYFYILIYMTWVMNSASPPPPPPHPITCVTHM